MRTHALTFARHWNNYLHFNIIFILFLKLENYELPEKVNYLIFIS